LDDEGRPGFKNWLERQIQVEGKRLPLTHIAKAIIAEDIIRHGKVKPSMCEVFKKPISYFFYGRPAYRVSGDGAIKTEAACPICFVFRPEAFEAASSMYPFDTGAFARRMYKTFILEEMELSDFQLDPAKHDPNVLISLLFKRAADYVKGDTTNLKGGEQIAETWEFHAKAFVDLVSSKGRNEPDDRIFSIELQLEQELSLSGNLRAVVVPHTLWSTASATPWIKSLHENGVEIETYTFIPNKHPEHFQGLIEAVVISLYEKWGVI
jgi:hypothetical protein